MAPTLEAMQEALPGWIVRQRGSHWVAWHPSGFELDDLSGDSLVQECWNLECTALLPTAKDPL
jgi:hypothetical protein